MTVTAEDETTLGAASRASSAGGVGGSTAPGGAVGKQQQGGGGNSESVLPTAVEFEPPFACVRRILKNALPSSTNVGKDASAAFARATGIFIIYLTACANDFARESKRQTITANDVLAAIKELDFDEFTPEMLKFLESYRSTEKSKRDAKTSGAGGGKKSGGKKTGGGYTPAAASAEMSEMAAAAAATLEDDDEDDDDAAAEAAVDDDEEDGDEDDPPTVGKTKTAEAEEDAVADDDSAHPDEKDDDPELLRKEREISPAPVDTKRARLYQDADDSTPTSPKRSKTGNEGDLP